MFSKLKEKLKNWVKKSKENIEKVEETVPKEEKPEKPKEKEETFAEMFHHMVTIHSRI